MDMEAGTRTEELVAGLAKGKRTKRRLRPLSPSAAAMTSSCSSGGASLSSTTFEGTDQEEEDMANCLILLAQGKGGGDDSHHNTNNSTKIDFYVYECKTCNRTFPSFQALGGHRASHKKPKVITTHEENKCDFQEEQAKQSHVQPVVPLQLGCGGGNNNINRGVALNKSKVHECSVCGSEFTSGQALGGHMRRHRASNTNSNVQNTSFDQVKPRNVLELDLNLPAPDDDIWEAKFQFPGNQNSLVLSAAPALVGCHY